MDSADLHSPDRLALDPVAAMAYRVKEARGLLTGSVVRHLQRAGFPAMRVAHTQVLENLPAEGIRLTVLAERAQVSHQAMGELVAELVDLGHLERVADPYDGRARLIRPTAAGQALIDQGRWHVQALRERWEQQLDGVTVEQVIEALAVLAEICSTDPSD